MVRLLKTAQEIQHQVERVVHNDQFVISDKIKIGIPVPMKLIELDENGCNWSMSTFRNAVGHLDTVRRAVDEVKKCWNLGS